MNLLNYSQLLSDPGEKACLERALRSAIHSIGADEGSLLLPVDSDRFLEFTICCTRTDTNPTIVGQRVPVTQGLVGLAAQTGVPQIGAPIFKGVIQAESSATDIADPLSVLAVPLSHHDKLLGVITLVSFNPSKIFTINDSWHYEALGELLSLLIHKQIIINEMAQKQGVSDLDTPEGRLLGLLSEIVNRSPQRLRSLVDLLQVIKNLK